MDEMLRFPKSFLYVYIFDPPTLGQVNVLKQVKYIINAASNIFISSYPANRWGITSDYIHYNRFTFDK